MEKMLSRLRAAMWGEEVHQKRELKHKDIWLEIPFQSILRVQAGSMLMLLAMSLPLSQKPWRR